MSTEIESTTTRPAIRSLAIGRLRHWLRREDGSSTVEFVILFPIFIIIFLATFEAGMLMVRQVMLDRGTDITVRALRLGQLAPRDEGDSIHNLLKRNVCSLAGILPDCMNNLMIELRPVSTVTWTPLTANPTCIDKDAIVQPVTNPVFGQQNEMMLVRVCARVKPYFEPHAWIFLNPAGPDGWNSLVSTTAFVNEPRG